jgi:hypothetical protein
MIQVNPNGESDCDASHMASGKVSHTGGLYASVLTACPVDQRLSAA